MEHYKVSYTVLADKRSLGAKGYALDTGSRVWTVPAFATVERTLGVKENVVYRDNEIETTLYYLSKKVDGKWYLLEGSEWIVDNIEQCTDADVLSGKFVELQ